MIDLNREFYPEQLKKMNQKELAELASEIRKFLIKKVSASGGHLAPNLGVVELTIAMLLAFSPPKDKIIWDVGHQSYVYKILTGRSGQFDSLRQTDGLSGFPKRCESPYDVFDSGHSSNSISAALGMAVSRDCKGGNEVICAVIGDGALTGGMAYEALNNAGYSKRKIIVILNDNEMSISKNHGSMAQYLGELRTSKGYNSLKKRIKKRLAAIKIGRPVYKVLESVRDRAKYAIIKNGVIFEELGFHYIGPIDGHNIQEIRDVLEAAREFDGPVLVHAITVKGKGYSYAEAQPDKFHGISSFNPLTGKLLKPAKHPTYSAVFGSTLMRMAGKDRSVAAISAAMINGTGLKDFTGVYPDRIFDVGIAEGHAVTFAAGMALSGMKPVVAIYSSFLQRAYDQIIIDVCQQNAHVIFAIDRAGIVGADGPTHNGCFDISYMLPLPGMTVMAPSSGQELSLMMEYGIDLEGPVSIRYPRGETPVKLPAEKMPHLPDLPAAAVYRTGSDVTLLAVGKMLENALLAADILAARNIHVEVIDPRVLKPFDKAAIKKSVQKTGLLVTLEDNIVSGGFGQYVSSYINESVEEKIQIINLGWPDLFIAQGSVADIEKKYGMDPRSIAEKVSEAVEGKTGRFTCK